MNTEDSISRAINFLANNMLPAGDLVTYISTDRQLQRSLRQDSCNFTMGIFLYAMRYVTSASSQELVNKAKTFLMGEIVEPGLWRYWTTRNGNIITPDADDTSLISFCLQNEDIGREIRHNQAILLKNRNPNGLFYTWLNPENNLNDIDSVVNANVLLYLGNRPETQAATQYLIEIVRANRETDSYWYYLDNMALYYAISRAYFHGITGFQVIRELLLEKVLKAAPKDPLNQAMALASLQNLEYSDKKVLNEKAGDLIAQQQANGSWRREPFYTGPEPPIPNSVWFGSEAITTSFCVEALARL